MSSKKSVTKRGLDLYHSVGNFNSWLIFIFVLVGLFIALCKTLPSMAFAVIGMVPYFVSTMWGLSHIKVGSFVSRVANSHRIMGALVLFLPMICTIRQQATEQHVSNLLYGVTCATLIWNCISGCLLIPTHIPSFDVPTLRAFHVGVVLGLAFVCQSLIFRYGTEEWFEPIGKCMVLYIFYAVGCAVNDSVQHIYTNLNNPFYASQIDLEYFQPPKTATQCGLVHKPFPISYLFWENLFKKPDNRI